MSVISRFRWQRSAIIALTFSLLLTFSSSIAAFASAKLVQISSDPYTNKTSQHKTQVEPDVYSFGSTVVATFQSGRFFNGGASNIGWATSHDGGATWTHGFLPRTTVNATPPGPYPRASDPSVAYDAKHKVWMISYLGLNANASATDVLVSRSTDGGLTWGNPVPVAHGIRTGELLDKNWT